MTMTDTNESKAASSKEDKCNETSREEPQTSQGTVSDQLQVAAQESGAQQTDAPSETLKEEVETDKDESIQPEDRTTDVDATHKTPVAVTEKTLAKTAADNSPICKEEEKGKVAKDIKTVDTLCDDSNDKKIAMRLDLSTERSNGKEQVRNMSENLQGFLQNLNTNDSPIQAVNQLTNVASSYTVQWPAVRYVNSTVENAKPRNTLTGAVSSAHKETRVQFGTSLEEDDISADLIQSDLVIAEDYETKSILEQTVGKLKLSQINGTLMSTSEEESQSSTAQLQSSEPPDYLQELLQRSHVNRRKVRGGNPIRPQRIPQPMFRRSTQLRNQVPKVVPAVSTADSSNQVNNASMDLSANVSVANLKYPVNNRLSSEDRYVINRSPFRKLAPKPNVMIATPQALTVAIGPTTPPTSLIRSPQTTSPQLTLPQTTMTQIISPSSFSPKLISPQITSPQLIVPLSRSNASPQRSNTPSSASSQPASPWLPNQQDQPLDLCTKSASNSEASSPPSSPSSDLYDENEPMDLSSNKSKWPTKLNYKPTRQYPPNNTGFWKTPPRGSMMGYHKPGGTSSPLEGDTASDTAANSPGLDNRKQPYGVIMSPEMLKGIVQMGGSPEMMKSIVQMGGSPEMIKSMVQMGGLPNTSQNQTTGYPEGAILLSGVGPHYRLPRNIALQHDEPPTPERPYMCDQCGATFKRNKSLTQHVSIHLNQGKDTPHIEIKPHACDMCPRRFAHHEQLRRHSRVHREDKTFVCENANCGKKFNDSSQLRLHMRTHSDHKPFSCPFCPLRFKYSGDVKRHVRIHTGEKPYVCGYCKMRFTQSNTLKQHERTHTGERPYHCHKCGMTFTQSGSLKYHLAHRHPPDVQTVFITTNSSTLTSATSPTMIQVSSATSPNMIQVSMNMNKNGVVFNPPLK